MKDLQKIEGSNIFLKECIHEIENAVDLDSITVERAVFGLFFLRCEAFYRAWRPMFYSGKRDSGGGVLSKFRESYALFRKT